MKRRDPKAFQSGGPPHPLLRSFSTMPLNHWCAVSPSPSIHPLKSPKAISLIRAPMLSGSWLVGLLNVRVTGDNVTLMPVGKLQRAINGGGVASRLLCVLTQAALILHRNKKAFVLVVKTFGAIFFSMTFFFCFLLHFLRGAQRGFGSRWHTMFLGSRQRSESSIPTSSRRQPSSS